MLNKRGIKKMKLLRQEIEKEGRKYTDFYYCWKYNGKTYKVRVRPVFNQDYDKLGAVAQKVPQGETLDKYID